MRVPLEWLREYVDVAMPPEELAVRLTMLGFEVKGIESGGAAWDDVVVGRLLSVERHPNAETLWVTSVEVGEAEPLGIVCGAQNLAVGQLVPVARVGAVLPGERRIEKAKIRGVVSDGMLCSPTELGLGEDADGILILGTGNEQVVGSILVAPVGETVLDVDVKPNRGDALSMIGLAREIAAATGTMVRWPDATVAESGAASAEAVSVEISDTELCPRFTARYLDGIGQAQTPAWMADRLIAAGMRPISPVVDVTNYVMHELGQPMHAYDADRVPGGRIVVRRARDGETLVTIDHLERRLDERMLVIADGERPIGFAGIMGGADTEVSDSTTRVILESAIFHGPTVRNTARRLGLRSEASMRHEKGISPDLPRVAADRAAALIAKITGARVATGIVDNDPGPHSPRVVEVDTARTARLLGIPVNPSAMETWLAPLGFAVSAADDSHAAVTVPLHRLDVVSDADVAEEVARAHGYDRIAGTLPAASLPAQPSRSGRAAPPAAAGARGLGPGRGHHPRLDWPQRPVALRIRARRRTPGAGREPAVRGSRDPATGSVSIGPGGPRRERPPAAERCRAVRGGQDLPIPPRGRCADRGAAAERGRVHRGMDGGNRAAGLGHGSLSGLRGARVGRSRPARPAGGAARRARLPATDIPRRGTE